MLNMRPEIEQAVEVMRSKIRALEGQASDLKKIVNRFYIDEKEAPPYADIVSDSTPQLESLRTDHFYGKTMAVAAQMYLEMRKARGLGSATVNDIYKALKEGGYEFNTAKEEYAKNGVRISLKKTPLIFRQLPNGDYGLCVWYGVKGRDEEARSPKKHGKKHHKRKSEPKPSAEKPPGASKGAQNGQSATNEAQHTGAGTASQPSLTAGTLEAFVEAKNRRMTELVAHFGVNRRTISKLFEPESKVYAGQKGWVKFRK